MSNTLNLGGGKWARKEGSLLAYNSENSNFKPLPFTFDRGSIGTVVNKQGLIETVGVDEPRIDFLNNTKGHLLLEPQRTNLITYSENLNGTGWSVFGASGGTCTRTLNYGISPDGTQNSTRAVFSDENTALYFNISISVVSTATIYVKGVAGEIIGFGFGASVADGSDFTFNGEWQRLVFSGSSGGSVTINTWAASRNARDFEIYGVQLEAGSYATSYIPTQGSAVTRSAESCSQTPPSGIIGQTEGTIYAQIGDLSKETDGYILELSDNSNANRIILQKNSSDLTDFRLYIQSSQGEQVNLPFNGDFSDNSKIAIAYANNDYNVYVNGVSYLNSSSLDVPTCNKISVGNRYNNTQQYGNGIKEIKLYNTRLSNSELQALTT